MSSWLIWLSIALPAAGIVTALMRRPGVLLYDWLATRARSPAPAAAPKKLRADKDHEPATQAG